MLLMRSIFWLMTENMRSQLNNEGKEQETIHQELLSNLVEITAKTEEMWAVLG